MKTRTSTAGSERGFTLLELLVVLFIVGLAASVVVFSAGNLRDRMRFTQEARNIYLTARHARETAILERRDMVLRTDEEAGRYWLDYGDDRTPEIHSIPEPFSFIGKDIFFFAKGNSSGGLIELKNEKGQKYAIEVNQFLGTSSIKRL